MSKHDVTKQQVLSGTANANIHFEDLCQLMTRFGFHNRTKGSHHIFCKSGIPDIVNLQPGHNGKAKPYQVKQVAKLINRFDLQ
jgi:predicted RNA binding protein YcfA (HicA-like mRNA interferase family)